MIFWPLRKGLLISSFAGCLLFAICTVSADEVTVPLKSIAMTDSPAWLLRLPQDEPIAFHGLPDMDTAGYGSSSVMYPAPDPVSFIAVVLTHGLLVESTKKAQKEKLRTAADQILVPYKTILENFNSRELTRRIIAKTSTSASVKFIDGATDTKSEETIDSIPTFFLTADQKTLILNNAIVIHMTNDLPEGTYHNLIRIVSTEKDVADPAIFWTSNNGENLKDESARLEAESLHIAMQEANAIKNGKEIAYQTVRYHEGSSEKFERAQVLNENCGRLLIRTLRGTLMSVPTSQNGSSVSNSNNCELPSVSHN